VAFPKKLLSEGEEIILDLRPHWWFLIGPLAATVVAAAVLAVVWLVLEASTPFVVLVAVLAVAVLLWFAGRWARWATTNFVVTSERLVHRHGVVAKQGMEIPLERVNNIAFTQSVLERMIGAGSLLIESAGESGQQTFSDIRRPVWVQNQIYRAMEAAAERDARRIGGGPPRQASIAEQIDELHQLAERGLSSREEYEAKKTQLLDRM
jgi:uncharacterized membrane protein YdbT with pleckstrin-like domain